MKLLKLCLLMFLTTSMYAEKSGFFVGTGVGLSKTSDSGKEYLSNGQQNSTIDQEIIDKKKSTYNFFVGYDYYIDNFLIGIELDFNKKRNSSFSTRQGPGRGPNDWLYTNDIDSTTSLRARLGYLITDKNLVFITVGKSKVRVHRKMYSHDKSIVYGDEKQKFSGNSFGLGYEYFLGKGISLKIDYNYIDYGNRNFHNDLTPQYRRQDLELKDENINIAIKYKF